MNEENNGYSCENCGAEINEDDKFCFFCGIVFEENIPCFNHRPAEAEGVCLVCGKPFCKKCGYFYNKKFLCNEHSEYEIYEGMARVYGSSDDLEIEYIIHALADNNLHPFKYNMKASPLSLGSGDYSLFRSSGDYRGQIINEIKIMIPFNEVLKAESIIEELIGEDENEDQ